LYERVVGFRCRPHDKLLGRYLHYARASLRPSLSDAATTSAPGRVIWSSQGLVTQAGKARPLESQTSARLLSPDCACNSTSNNPKK
jgi:hypothetical protein